MANDSSLERPASSSQWLNSEHSAAFKRNKSLQKLLPKDNRKYKDKSLQDFVNTHTFKPNSMGLRSKELAEAYHKKIRVERSRSKDNFRKSIKLTDNPYVPDSFYGGKREDPSSPLNADNPKN